MKNKLSIKEAFQQISRELDDDLGGMWVQIQALEGAKELIHDIVTEFDTELHRKEFVSPSEGRLNLKLNAIYELMNHSLYELRKHEKEARKQSTKIFDHFAVKTNIEQGSVKNE